MNIQLGLDVAAKELEGDSDRSREPDLGSVADTTGVSAVKKAWRRKE
jgi:hypothetical protein